MERSPESHWPIIATRSERVMHTPAYSYAPASGAVPCKTTFPFESLYSQIGSPSAHVMGDDNVMVLAS